MVSSKELIERTMSNLEQISKLSINQKLKVENQSGYITVDTSPFQSLSRRFNGHNRDDTLSKIQENVSHCMLLIEFIYEMITVYEKKGDSNYDIIMINKYNERKKLYAELVSLLSKTTIGINSLIATYNDDIKIRIQLEELNKSIEKFLSSYKKE